MKKQTYYKPVLCFEGGFKIWRFKPIADWIWKQLFETNNEVARSDNHWKLPNKKPKFPIKEFRLDEADGLHCELIDGCIVTVEFEPVKTK